MAFERREGNIGENITRYADRHLTKCPYCKAVHPLWLSDAKPIKIEGENDSISFQFKCPRCGGIIEYVSESERAFEINDEFKSIKMIDPGRGTNNLNLINISLSPDQIYALINNFGVTTTSQHVLGPNYNGNNKSNTQKDNRGTHALLGMIFGIIGLVSCFFGGAGIFYSIPGLILSIMGLKSTKSHSKAIAGLVTSIIGLGIEGILILLAILAIFPFFIFF
jgi:phage FluMu protein Com